MPRSKRNERSSPYKAVAVGFLVAIVIGTLLLMLPFATTGAGGAPFRVASFTSVSALCVTGLTVVDTAAYWTPAGQAIIALLIQIGGLGIMTGASLILFALSGRIGLRERMRARHERGSVNLGDVRSVIIAVVVFSLLAELLFALWLSIGFWIEGAGFGSGLWQGLFHSISGFNNAGFALFSDGLVRHASDPLIVLPIAIAVIVGGLGFPVWLELRKRFRQPKRWSLHTKLTIAMTAGLLVFGWIVISILEWDSPLTMGPLSFGEKLINGFFSSASWRTAGFSSIDYSQVGDETLLTSIMLMFVGGGTGSTAGGLKVTTFALLALMAIAEIRGQQDVTAFNRRIPGAAQRQVLTIAFAAVNLVVIGTLALLLASDFPLADCLFEAVSAFGTVGLSTGITGELSGTADAILMVLMYLGRVGPLTLAVALALREQPQRTRYPEERPLVG
jgi:potassium uptake TrkH family protein